jgi:hypothetical protein
MEKCFKLPAAIELIPRIIPIPHNIKVIVHVQLLLFQSDYKICHSNYNKIIPPIIIPNALVLML